MIFHKIKKEGVTNLQVRKSLIKWKKENQNTFETLISTVKGPTVLNHSDFDKDFIRHIGTSECVQYWKHKSHMKVVGVRSEKTGI